jgi:hypothetical protein
VHDGGRGIGTGHHRAAGPSEGRRHDQELCVDPTAIAALEATTSHTDEGAFQEIPAATGSGFVIYIVARTELFWAHELSE